MRGRGLKKGAKPNCVLCGDMIMSAKKSNRMFCDVCREKKKIVFMKRYSQRGKR
jgi:formylmethanofuran dehydrogenase subunit E